MFRCLFGRKKVYLYDDSEIVCVPHTRFKPNPYFDAKNLKKINNARIGQTVNLEYICENGVIYTQPTLVQENDRSIAMKEIKNVQSFRFSEQLQTDLIEDYDADVETEDNDIRGGHIWTPSDSEDDNRA